MVQFHNHQEQFQVQCVYTLTLLGGLDLENYYTESDKFLCEIYLCEIMRVKYQVS